jgi:hypothetical protein
VRLGGFGRVWTCLGGFRPVWTGMGGFGRICPGGRLRIWFLTRRMGQRRKVGSFQSAVGSGGNDSKAKRRFCETNLRVSHLLAETEDVGAIVIMLPAGDARCPINSQQVAAIKKK